MTGIDAIAELFAGPGARDYLGEAVTIGEHMRQAGALAEAAGAAAAAGGRGPAARRGAPARRRSDARHGRRRSAVAGQWFGAAVTEPVRLHVAAKRYLCATEPGYFALLSPESVRTLALQGGPMTPEQAAAFGRCPTPATRWPSAAGTTRPRTPRSPRPVRALRRRSLAKVARRLTAGLATAVRDRALTAVELRTLKATARPR